MTSPTPQSDPFGYRAQLEECLAMPEYASALGGADGDYQRNAAYLACENRGYCLLGGVALEGALAAPLPVVIATAGARDAVRVAELGVRSVDKLPARFDYSRSQAEVDSAVSGGLQIRMHLHAAFQAIDETLMSSLDKEEDVAALTNGIHEMGEVMTRLDERLHDELDLVSMVCETNLLKNMRAELSAEWHEILPWWLDGTIEEAYERSVAEATASLPTSAWWARLRNAGDGGATTTQVVISGNRRSIRAPYMPSYAAADDNVPPTPKRIVWRSEEGSEVELMMSPNLPEEGKIEFRIYGRDGKPLEEVVGGILEVPGSRPLRLLIEVDNTRRVVARVSLAEFRAASGGIYPERLLVNREPFELANR